MRLKRLLGAENGWAGAAGTLLLLGFGLFILLVSVAELREASRLKPEERGCAAWLEDPSGPRWVTLVGCTLDLERASAAGEGRLLVPLAAGELPPSPRGGEGRGEGSRGVLATKDPALLALLAELARLAPTEVPGYLETKAPLREPKTLTGYSHTADGAVVLEQGGQPQRAQVLFGLVVGVLAVALGTRSMFLRYLVDRDSAL